MIKLSKSLTLSVIPENKVQSKHASATGANFLHSLQISFPILQRHEKHSLVVSRSDPCRFVCKSRLFLELHGEQ